MARTEVATRDQLIEAAARILAEDGIGALSTRRLANELGVSTMVVYTRFGSMPELMDAVVAEGFDRQAASLDAVAETDDASADLVELGIAYRANALANPHLYTIMYAGNSEQQHRAHQAKGTNDRFTAAAARALGSGLAAGMDPAALGEQVWSVVHGWVSLELAGIVGARDADVDLRATLERLLS